MPLLPPATVPATAPPASALQVAGDPLRAEQRHLPGIGWTPPPRTAGPLVAVLDTGVDATHPDLKGAIDTAGARSFTDGAGTALQDTEGHGTHVAGIIGAVSNNGVGVSGVSSARLLPVKIADASGRSGTSALVRGIRYATAKGARIINISFGGGGYSPLEQEAIDAAVRRGVLVVAAAGNSGRAVREFPGAYRHVLAVAAVDDAGTPLPSSTSGQQIAIAAPGQDILSTVPGGYARLSGTSMAAAVVTGAAARVWGARPSLTADQVAALLVGTARDAGTPGADPATGAGEIRLRRALAAPAPQRDLGEPNDDTRQAGRSRPALMGTGPATAVLRATAGPWRDPRDGYRVSVQAGDRLQVRLAGPRAADFDLRLWRPGAPPFRSGVKFARTWLAAVSLGPTAAESLQLVAPAAGVYTVEVTAIRGSGPYRLTVTRDRVPQIAPTSLSPVQRPSD